MTGENPALERPSENHPAHMLAYRDLRQMILSGELAPGQAVTIQGLVAALGAGMTPVREAIRRLTSEGALRVLGNRRVCVPTLTLEELEELEFARTALEPQLALWAAEKIEPETIERMARIDAELNAAIDRGDVRGYMIHNHRFHATLYAASGAEILLGLADALWLRAAPSLRVMCGRFGTQNLPDLHEEALAALRSGDGPAVAEAIRQDIVQGMENIRAALREEEALPDI